MHPFTFYGRVHHTFSSRLLFYSIIPNTLEKVHGIEQEIQWVRCIARVGVKKWKLVWVYEEWHCFSGDSVVVGNDRNDIESYFLQTLIVFFITTRSLPLILQVGRTCTTNLYLERMLVIMRANADLVLLCCCLQLQQCYHLCNRKTVRGEFYQLTLWCLAAFGDFRKKKRLNAHGFAREFLRSGMLYRPGKSLKRRGKSSSLHLKKIFLFGACGFFCEYCIVCCKNRVRCNKNKRHL